MNPETCLEAQQPWLPVHSPRTQSSPAWVGAQHRHLEPLSLKRCLHILWAHWECQTTAWGVKSLPQPRYSLLTDLQMSIFQYKIATSTPKQHPRTTLCSELWLCQSFLRCNPQLSPQSHSACDITKPTLEVLGKPPLVASYPSAPSCSSSSTIERATLMQN